MSRPTRDGRRPPDRDELPAPPPRQIGKTFGSLATSPGARKEALKKRDYVRGGDRGGGGRGRRGGPGYVELRAASAFSFLDGASPPEDLVAAAAAAGLPAMAIVDRDGVYGAPRFHQAAKEAGLRALIGAEVTLDDDAPAALGLAAPAAADGAGSAPAAAAPRLTLLVEDRRGYRNLCRLLTSAALGPPGSPRRGKGEARAWWELIAEHSEGLHCLTGGDEGPVARALAAGGSSGGSPGARAALERLAALFPGRLHVELQRHRLREEEHRNRALIELARSLRLPLVATNGVRYARPEDKPLHDVLTATRHHTTLDAAGRLLAAERERHVRGAAEMAELFADLPAAVAASAELAGRLGFTLADLGYRFPDYPLPPGETAGSYLRQLTWNAARARFRPLTARAQRQLEHELRVIEKLDLAGYFLIVWDVVRFCREQGILVQGRGSAANSAVCYALGITAVDPVKMDLLFERFLSEERGEWPDIDLDLPSGEKRERVIQHVYARYGERGAAMTANVITYRERSAAREVAKALGFSRAQEDRLANRLGGFFYDVDRGAVKKDLTEEIRGAGLDPSEPRLALFADLWRRIQHLPRHLGQHSGGMVLAAGRLDDVVPLEPASMPGRVVVQWDKDDCADLGIIKVDLLGLGMLDALEEAVPLIREREGVHVDLAHLPPDDPKTYEMIRAADTVGVFQIESRAQMATLPRNRPERFYDLVIQVAIIRPGPIAGNLANPYFERRAGRQPVTYPHPSLEPILARTLGVPIFQEQILRVAMVAAGFSGGEAEQLRRAMGFKRSVDKMEAIEGRLRAGMAERGIAPGAQEEILRAITSFALYGFPESHAASFALIAYASAYLKAHHPTAFYLSLLNAWPMGFYHPASLVQDAQRHGVEVRPIDVARSGWRCRWEDHDAPARRPHGALRLGLRFVKGLRKTAGEAIEREQAEGPFSDPDDLARRCRLRSEELAALAQGGALHAFGLGRRAALWQAARAGRGAGPLLAGLPDEAPSPLPEMSPVEETLADFATARLTTGPHPVAHLRGWLDRRRVVTTRGLGRLDDGRRVRTAGAVIVRQRPGTAKGVLFLTLEDETGMAQAIVHPGTLERYRHVIAGSRGLVVEGIVQRRDGSASVLAERFWPLDPKAAAPSHDWR